MAVRIKKEVRGHQAEAEWLPRRARHHIRSLSRCRVPAAAALSAADLSILLTGDAGIRTLNRRWRAKDKATDVLSFPLLDLDSLGELGRRAKKNPEQIYPWELGDIVISVDTAKRQAKAHGLTLRQELDLLLVHGILHLLGFDHELGVDHDATMRRWERKLLGRDGLTANGMST
ncbi:MAG: rRNA maturation RNase YbeY [Proteobacteria bacterium]|nr:MAG: rRNA maturation RNase YbeY [Pseudomonadota bacterium]